MPTIQTVEEAIRAFREILLQLQEVPAEFQKFGEYLGAHYVHAATPPNLRAIQALVLRLTGQWADLSAIERAYHEAVRGYTNYGRQQEKERRDRKPETAKQTRNARVRELADQGMEPAEICEALRGTCKLTPSNVRQILHRGRKKK